MTIAMLLAPYCPGERVLSKSYGALMGMLDRARWFNANEPPKMRRVFPPEVREEMATDYWSR